MTTDFFSLEFIEDLGLSHLTFKRKCTSEEYRLAYTKLIELFEEKGHHNHVTDTSSLGTVGIADQQWVKSDVVPNLRKIVDKAHKLNIALILGNDIFATFAAKNIARNFMDKQNIDIHYFPVVAESFEWFKQERELV
ncbi:hypothetical protein R9C00_13515 [Flammeovirgaceae bacterium SG7u.111]|nr:hypothetical protein [Flammeovirgaceae bacterium SG7u.132]WPO38476.1 hypothetical protein R9C00_13515 [Flammeovirgaceae bacterium SG7u.111]